MSQEISIEFGEHDFQDFSSEINKASSRDADLPPLPPQPYKSDESRISSDMTEEEFEESERKRKEGTVKVTIRNSELYVRYDENKTPKKSYEISENILKEGTLCKRAVGKSKVGRTNWKDRFFRLTTLGLSYWDSDPRSNETAKKKGQLPLAAIRSVVEVAKHKDEPDIPSDVLNKSKFVLQIKYDIWVLYVQAPSLQEVADWKSKLLSASAATRANLRQLSYSEPWFFGSINKTAVQETLLAPGSSTGDFLVTQGASNPKDFQLAIRTGPETIKTFPIVERDDIFAIRSSRVLRDSQIEKVCSARFRTLPDLINALKKGGPYGDAMTALSEAYLLRPAIKSTALPVFARVQQSTSALNNKRNSTGKIGQLSARALLGTPRGNHIMKRPENQISDSGQKGSSWMMGIESNTQSVQDTTKDFSIHGNDSINSEEDYNTMQHNVTENVPPRPPKSQQIQWVAEEFGGFSDDDNAPPRPPKTRIFDPEGYGFDDESDDEDTYDSVAH